MQSNTCTPQHGLNNLVRSFLEDYLLSHKNNLPSGLLHSMIIEEVEKPLIELIMNLHSGNQIQAARTLGINRNTLRKKIQFYGISYNHE